MSNRPKSIIFILSTSYIPVILKIIKIHDMPCGARKNVPLEGFDIYFSAWNTQTLTKIKTGTTIVYDKVLTNEGNGYSNVNGKFTAPRDGPYVFAWTVVVKDNFMINIFIYHNGNRLSVAQADSEYNNLNNSGSNTIVLNLKKNDVVQLKCGRMGTVRKNYLHGNGHSTFSGWLL
ncbi:hypothetical protein FSP39_017004 [Pinctada imbricata]|uniref:C1q domain-containing protein n=1 Tax=Pinctada imbricata TaxID=66713 RepID=A0AA88XRS9_PINIB|nr:hypothetical protein FSP39_017004 [Pinctada imbricata]